MNDSIDALIQALVHNELRPEEALPVWDEINNDPGYKSKYLDYVKAHYLVQKSLASMHDVKNYPDLKRQIMVQTVSQTGKHIRLFQTRFVHYAIAAVALFFVVSLAFYYGFYNRQPTRANQTIRLSKIAATIPVDRNEVSGVGRSSALDIEKLNKIVTQLKNKGYRFIVIDDVKGVSVPGLEVILSRIKGDTIDVLRLADVLQRYRANVSSIPFNDIYTFLKTQKGVILS